MLIGVKEVGKPLEMRRTSEKYRSDCCTKIMGLKEFDRCDYIALSNDGLFLALDEEGLLKDLPINFYIETTSTDFPIQKMVGTAVFVRIKPVNVWEHEIWDFEVEPMTTKDCFLVANILNEEYQASLQKRFKDYGRGYGIVREMTEEELRKRFGLE